MHLWLTVTALHAYIQYTCKLACVHVKTQVKSKMSLKDDSHKFSFWQQHVGDEKLEEKCITLELE